VQPSEDGWVGYTYLVNFLRLWYRAASVLSGSNFNKSSTGVSKLPISIATSSADHEGVHTSIQKEQDRKAFKDKER
jgi:hypothetical protein